MIFGENISQQHASAERSILISILCDQNSYSHRMTTKSCFNSLSTTSIKLYSRHFPLVVQGPITRQDRRQEQFTC